MTYEKLQNIRDGKCLSVDRQIDASRISQAAVNRKRLEPIIKTIILCGRQNIPLRGHRDYGEISFEQEPIANEGNFRTLLRMRFDAGDENLTEHFKHAAKNATYISWNMQNQIINACNEVILNHLVKKINSAKCFSLLADETCDISTTEQLSLCVRYIDEENDSKLCEQFLQFVPVTSTTGKNLSQTILESLNNYGIDLCYLRGQGYDGAASMSGKFNGVQAHISAIYPQALYVHCASHSLNLAIGNAVSVIDIRNCIGIIEKVHNFFNTPKRQKILIDNIDKHVPDTKRQKLRQVCPTRWVERHEAIMTMAELYDAVIYSLETISSWEDRDSSSNAKLLSNSLCEFGFIISLFSLQNIFAYTLPLSKILQKSDNDLLIALNFVDDVVAQLRIVREKPDSPFKDIFDEACIKANNFNIDIKKPRTASKQTLRSNVPADSVEEYFRRNIFIPFIDQILNQLHEGFTRHSNTLKHFFILLPNGKDAPTASLMDDFRQLCEFYARDLISTNPAILNAEFKLWRAKFGKAVGTDPCKNAIDAITKCDKMIYPNIYNLLKILATLPVTTCVSERSFSTLRILKTYLRSTMTQPRLNGLALLYIHRGINITVTEVIEELCKKKRKLDFIL
ncbi:52 kDa repressor of the inhibitor of the protein kinase-like [Lasioglossum baleicum]|uniref:52 kDa repressor of the inhibitor of the protein kinase-like n=1 Tax=Lasioglossum baleicum TaxID=434251 RepID=UPI003FCCC74C